METKNVEVFRSLVGAQIRAWNAVNSALKSVEKMSAARFALLSCLQDAPKGLGVAQLAASQRITVGAASKLCDRLEADGLIKRRGVEGDQRRQIMSLTETGSQAVAQATSLVEEAMTVFLSVLDDEQSLMLAELLARLDRGE